MDIQKAISNIVIIADNVRQGFETNFYKWQDNDVKILQTTVQQSFNGYMLVDEIEETLAGVINDSDRASLLCNIEARLNRHLFFVDMDDLEKSLPECENIKNAMIHSIAEWNNHTSKTIEEGLKRLHKMFDSAIPTTSTLQPQGGTDGIALPDELNTPTAQKAFANAIKHGYISRTATGYKWANGKPSQLAYFLYVVYCPTLQEEYQETAYNKLFGVTRLLANLTQVLNAKHPQRWRQDIESLLE